MDRSGLELEVGLLGFERWVRLLLADWSPGL